MTAIAIVALIAAALALGAVRHLSARVAELEALAEAAAEEEEEDGSQEVWLSDGEFYVPDKDVLDAETGALAYCTYEGVPCAVVKGQGVVSLHKLLTDAAKVRAIKP